MQAFAGSVAAAGDHGDEGEQGGHAHDPQQKHQRLVCLRHGQPPVGFVHLHSRSAHSDRIPAG
jgi:hypothetical protein